MFIPKLSNNPHRMELVARVGCIASDADFISPDINYLFVLFTNRCGSNFLAQALASSGVINEAGEFFNASTMLSHVDDWNISSVQEYFLCLTQSVTRNRWLAAKLAVEHVDILREAGILDRILERSHFILLERQDRLAQAISRCIAWQNCRWTSEQPSLIPDECLVYSRQCIDQQLRQVEVTQGMIYRFLAETGKAPLHFSYEAFVRQPQLHLDEIAGRLHLPRLELDLVRIRIKRQSNGVNDAWRRRYLSGG